jgi:hypothetical protein
MHVHYHIRWSGKESLDWESFGMREEAETGAKRLVRSGETYVIEEFGAECPRCRAAMQAKTDHNTSKAAST